MLTNRRKLLLDVGVALGDGHSAALRGQVLFQHPDLLEEQFLFLARLKRAIWLWFGRLLLLLLLAFIFLLLLRIPAVLAVFLPLPFLLKAFILVVGMALQSQDRCEYIKR